jgi:hypothetical protein
MNLRAAADVSQPRSRNGPHSWPCGEARQGKNGRRRKSTAVSFIAAAATDGHAPGQSSSKRLIGRCAASRRSTESSSLETGRKLVRSLRLCGSSVTPRQCAPAETKGRRRSLSPQADVYPRFAIDRLPTHRHTPPSVRRKATVRAICNAIRCRVLSVRVLSCPRAFACSRRAEKASVTGMASSRNRSGATVRVIGVVASPSGSVRPNDAMIHSPTGAAATEKSRGLGTPATPQPATWV